MRKAAIRVLCSSDLVQRRVEVPVRCRLPSVPLIRVWVALRRLLVVPRRLQMGLAATLCSLVAPALEWVVQLRFKVAAALRVLVVMSCCLARAYSCRLENLWLALAAPCRCRQVAVARAVLS